MAGPTREGIGGFLEYIHGERRLQGAFLWSHYIDVINRIWYPKGARGIRLAIPRLNDMDFSSAFEYGVPEIVTGEDSGTGAPGWSITNTDGGVVGLEPNRLRTVARDQLNVPVIDLIDNVIVHELVHVHTNQLAFDQIQDELGKPAYYEPTQAELEESIFRLSESEVQKVTGVIMTDRTTDALLQWMDQEVL